MENILDWIMANGSTIGIIAAVAAVVFGKSVGPKLAAVLRMLANALDGASPVPTPTPTPTPNPFPVPVPTPGPDIVPSDRPILDIILKLLPTILPVILPLLTTSKNPKLAKLREAVAELDVATVADLVQGDKVA